MIHYRFCVGPRAQQEVGKHRESATSAEQVHVACEIGATNRIRRAELSRATKEVHNQSAWRGERSRNQAAHGLSDSTRSATASRRRPTGKAALPTANPRTSDQGESCRRETAARDFSSSPRGVGKSCGTCGCGRRRRRSGSAACGRSASRLAPAQRLRADRQRWRGVRLPLRRPRGRIRMYWPLAAAMGDAGSETIFGGYSQANSANTTGNTAISQKVTAICSGE